MCGQISESMIDQWIFSCCFFGFLYYKLMHTGMYILTGNQKELLTCYYNNLLHIINTLYYYQYLSVLWFANVQSWLVIFL